MSVTIREETSHPDVEAHEPIAASESERAGVTEVATFLQRQRGQTMRLVSADGETVELPETASHLLRALIYQLSLDHAVSIVPVEKQLTTQQAADLLNISRPFLIQLLERGEIPFERVGTHRRVSLREVIAYRQRRAEQEESALDDLALDGLELGL